MADPNSKSNLGLLASGIIMCKNQFPGRDGKPDRFGFELAIPGCRELLSVSVKPEIWGGLQVQQEWKGLVSFRLYKGAVYFETVTP